MVHQMTLHSIRYEQEIAAANYPAIRHFYVPTLTNLQHPADDLPVGYWKWANPQDVLQFSAVAYFFAKALYEKYHVPIGLINASVGGTPVEAWTSEEGLKAFPDVQNTIEKNKDTAYINATSRAAAAWNAALPKPQDMGVSGPLPWYDTTYIPTDWQRINIPGYWEDQGIANLDGIVWYRKVIDIPAAMTGIPATVFLGRIVDADALYINGMQAGATGYQYPQRRYRLPAGSLKPGRNTFVIRVTNIAGKGGFVPDKPYAVSAGGQSVDLNGYWQYKVGAVFTPQPKGPAPVAFQLQPSALYNAMVAPLTKYAVKGFCWYQGEANTDRPLEYAKLMAALIADWRSQWHIPAAPFLFVQLPNFMDVSYLPAESKWAQLREAQRQTLQVPNTAMAVAIDLGEWNDIHPDNKKDVGIRLALAAQQLAYGDQQVVASGPLYQSARAEGKKIILQFSNTASGLVSSNGLPLQRFAIAGSNQQYVWANATIEGNSVVVWNDAIAHPMYVRYAWADNPLGANLYNKEGLPASPFQAVVQADTAQ